jgi:hypothetical protein
MLVSFLIHSSGSTGWRRLGIEPSSARTAHARARTSRAARFRRAAGILLAGTGRRRIHSSAAAAHRIAARGLRSAAGQRRLIIQRPLTAGVPLAHGLSALYTGFDPIPFAMRPIAVRDLRFIAFVVSHLPHLE